MPRTDTPPQLYARNLLPLRYGYPLWTPEPGNQFLTYRRKGLEIGDVGVIVPENGSFDVFFNICLPREHPFHLINGVPENFTPIHLNPLDISDFAHAEPPGRVLSTTSVTTLRKVQPSAGTSSGWNYEFNLSSSEGALLILSDGAESYSLRKKQLFSDVATQHGMEWYNFARQRLGRIIGSDSLYLITGLYKSRSWSVAGFHETTGTAQQFRAQFKASPNQISEGNHAPAYSWETMRALHWRVGPLTGYGDANQSVFIHGFKIAIRDSLLGKRRVEVQVDVPPRAAQPRPSKFLSGGQGRSNAQRFWRRLLPRGVSGSGAGVQGEDQGADNPSIPNGARNNGGVTVSHIPQTPQSVHPSDVINRYLLRNDPSAIISVVHDSQWTVLLEKGLLKAEDLEDEGRLGNIMFENYRLLSRDGVAFLKSTRDVSIRGMDHEDTAYQAWKADKLVDAEETVSKQIIQTAGSNHSAFANRALIRTRMRRWDAALGDAETSIGIQSSVLGYIAKGFALFGVGKYGDAIEALNIAICDCDPHDKDFAVLIKSVVLFEAKYHAEGMACIADLLEHCSEGIKSTCTAVQAHMYLQLATLAVENKDSERALQLLEKAGSLAPFDETMDLDLLSLVSGWRFDGLEFTVRQQQCERLHVYGKTKEAAVAFQAITQDLGEDVKAKKENVEWLNKFRSQCFESLESLGDAALQSKDYSEAISLYSISLNMNPDVRDGILVKRSKAYWEIFALDDALNDANEAITLNPASPWGFERKYYALRRMERHDEAVTAFNSMTANLKLVDELRPGAVSPSQLPTTLREIPPAMRLDGSSVAGSIAAATQHLGSNVSGVPSIFDTPSANRDEMVQGRPLLTPQRQADSPEVINIAGEAFPAVVMHPDEQDKGNVPVKEREETLREKLTAHVKEYPEQEKQVLELVKMVMRLANQAVVPQNRNNIVEGPTVQELLEELRMYNTRQKEILEALSEHWKNDSGGGDKKQNDSNKVLRPFRTLRDEVADILADEIEKIMADFIRLGEERQRMQQEIGELMALRSKYGPGGEFDPGWKPPWDMPPLKGPPRPNAPRTHKKKGNKYPADPDKAEWASPGWRSVAFVTPKPLTPVASLERDFFGLFGPLTPEETPIALPEANLDWESRQASPQPAGVDRNAYMKEALLFRAEREVSASLSPAESFSEKQAPPHSPQSPPGSFTPALKLSEGLNVTTPPKSAADKVDFIDTQHSAEGPLYSVSSYLAG